jgi:cell division protein FtsB
MHWINRTLLAALVICAVAYVPRQLYEGTVADDTARVQSERDGLDEANRVLREEIRLLRAEIEAFKRDRREVERIAREDLNLVRPEEVVFEVERPAEDKERTRK